MSTRFHKAGAPLAPSEKDIQSQIIELLGGYLGCTVLVTTVKLRGKMAGRHSTGQSKGIPDLIVTKNWWPEGIWLGLEVKGPTTKLSQEQEALLEACRIIIVRSIEDAKAAVQAADALFRAGYTAPNQL